MNVATDGGPARRATAQQQAYAERLRRLSRRGGVLRRLFEPQRLYRRRMRTMRPGFMLDVGCGIGRTLSFVDGHGVGIDTNPACVAAARRRGFVALSPDDFGDDRRSFDSVVFAHVLEHLGFDDAVEIVRRYAPRALPAGQVIIISPQQRGQRSDPTHLTLIGSDELVELARRCDLRLESVRSFPVPRRWGAWFTHNETIAVLRRS